MFSNTIKLGVLGGGQLGAMLIRHAIDFGLDVRVMDADASAPCARYSGSFVQGSLLDYEAVMKFGEGLDVLTIEIEAVNVEALKSLRDRGLKVWPAPELIEMIQDKGTQKKALMEAGIPVVPGVRVESKEALRQHVHRLPAVLKLRKGGYDGKGVMILHEPSDINEAFDGPCVLEELADIAHEIAVMVARNEKGETVAYDPVRMVFDEALHLLDYQVCPAGLSDELRKEAVSLAVRVAEGLHLVGLLAIEMFVTRDGRVLVNELAPRPHNSGHHTIEACETSQYENLLRAVLGLALGSTRIVQDSVMVNIIEPSAEWRKAMYDSLQSALSKPGVHLHWYGKGGGRPGRKMGHITVCSNKLDDALVHAIELRSILKT